MGEVLVEVGPGVAGLVAAIDEAQAADQVGVGEVAVTREAVEDGMGLDPGVAALVVADDECHIPIFF